MADIGGADLRGAGLGSADLEGAGLGRAVRSRSKDNAQVAQSSVYLGSLRFSYLRVAAHLPGPTTRSPSGRSIVRATNGTVVPPWQWLHSVEMDCRSGVVMSKLP